MLNGDMGLFEVRMQALFEGLHIIWSPPEEAVSAVWSADSGQRIVVAWPGGHTAVAAAVAAVEASHGISGGRALAVIGAAVAAEISLPETLDKMSPDAD
jgi:hypothetical protein